MRRFLRWVSRRAWNKELEELSALIFENRHLMRELALVTLNQDTLVTLFREKQSKIDRLQRNYAERTAPLREDLRGERPMGTLKDHLSLLAQSPYRHDVMRKRGFRGKPSDGTVEGVPFDEPNEPATRAWEGPRASLMPNPVFRTGAGHRGFDATGAIQES